MVLTFLAGPDLRLRRVEATKGLSRGASDDRVRGALRRAPGSAGKQGYGRSPELSSRLTYILSSTFEGSSHLERPERRFFLNLHFCLNLARGGLTWHKRPRQRSFTDKTHARRLTWPAGR